MLTRMTSLTAIREPAIREPANAKICEGSLLDLSEALIVPPDFHDAVTAAETQ